MIRTFLLMFVLAGFSTAPLLPPDFTLTAEQCRGYGIQAEGEPTGKVVAQFNHIPDRCFEGIPDEHWPEGCSIETGDHEYAIYYERGLKSCAPQHEWCHAAFDKFGHTTRFDLHIFQGDRFAACPPGGWSLRQWLHDKTGGLTH